MKNYDQSVETNHNPNWRHILDHPYRILIIGVSGLGKTNVLLILTKHQRPDTDKIQLCKKDPFEAQHLLFITGRKRLGIKTTKNPKEFIDCSQTIDDVYDNLEKT